MVLKITSREVDGVTVLTLEGQLGLGEAVNSLRERVKALLADGKRKILVDMGKVTLIDSAGLGALVGLHQSVSSRGAALRLCSLGPKIRELLQMTRLLTVFSVSVDEAEGLRAFTEASS